MSFMASMHGQKDLAKRANAFAEKHGISRDELDPDHFSAISEGIASWGEKDLERAMQLAPRKGGFWYERPEHFAVYAARLGFNKTNEIFARLKAEGISPGGASYLLYHLTLFPYRKGAEKTLVDAVGLAKKAGVSAEEFAFPVYNCLRRGKGRKDEIAEVLKLAREHELKTIEHNELEAALHYWRMKSTRPFVAEAFGKKNPYLLYMRYGSEGFAYFFAAASVGLDKVDKLVFEANSKDARERTAELMQPHFARLGVFGADRQLVESLAENPLFSPDALKLRKSEAATRLRLVDYASDVFGRDAVRSITGLAGGKNEPEFALALLKMCDHRKLLKLLSSVPSGARHAAVRVINHHGPEILSKSLRIVRESKLDPQAFLQPVAQGLAARGKQFAPLRPASLAQVAGPEHEEQLRFFHGQPALWQRRMAQAVWAYRRIYGHTLGQIMGVSGPLVSAGF